MADKYDMPKASSASFSPALGRRRRRIPRPEGQGRNSIQEHRDFPSIEPAEHVPVGGDLSVVHKGTVAKNGELI